ncbi:MAG: late competence development ComFB family protein [Ruminococcus sp.]|nr:late competence development ComFB family protein [Ruminococcus sp.]MCM1382441.1 late competence development ComFB family protein [Muribaculaceae bacterium]MCM1480233.1 late competence development ComFB family protein [Muribaculaceae bacterium]
MSETNVVNAADINVVNVMEEVVKERLELFLMDVDCCKCDTCKGDMLAMALNALKPKYVNSRKGELFTKLNATKMQNTVDIDVAVAKAIAVVSASPHRK